MARMKPVSLLVLSAPLVLGCGGADYELETAPVRGTITLEGEAIPWGTIVFTPLKGRAATGTIQEDGTYRLSTYGDDDGAQAGEHVVTIRYTDQRPDAPFDPLNPQPRVTWLIPERYGHPGASGLKFTVEAGIDNEANFDLKKK